MYLLEIVLRSRAVYAAVLALIRIGGRREIGQLTPFDLVFVVTADADVERTRRPMR